MLKKVIIVARHGPRNPIKIFNKLDQTIWTQLKSNDEEYLAEKTALTKSGEELCKQFGKQLKEKYYDVLKLNETNISFYSSHTPRTKNSAILVAESFLPYKLKENDLNFHKSIAGDPFMRFGDEYQTFKKLITEIDINDSIGDINKHKLTEHIREHLTDIESNNHFFDIRSTIECYKFEGVDLPKEITENHISDIDVCATAYYKKLVNHEFMEFLGREIHEFVNHLLLDNDNKFVYLSTHDTIVFPLSQHLNKNHTKLPQFCSHIKYELYEDKLEVYYDDDLIFSKNVN